jgi:hypothetical protein
MLALQICPLRRAYGHCYDTEHISGDEGDYESAA